MTILTVNVGSSSVRLAAFTRNPASSSAAASERYDLPEYQPLKLLRAFLRHHAITEISAVAHRVVHGGAGLVDSCLVDPRVEAEIERLAPLAPLHNPAALNWIRSCRELLGSAVPQIAVFDTAFYASLPAVAATYALPRDLCRRHRIRRYGFHGLAHRGMWRRWRELHPRLEQGGRVISLQLAAGCSITAIHRGKALDTSMGFSPLEGLVMATRAGDVDPGLFAFLHQAENLTPAKMNDLLNNASGLLGVSGLSADMRRLLGADDIDARLAVDIYCYRARKYLGAYLAVLGGADGILFGGGVGENAALVRQKILTGLEWCGIACDVAANAATIAREGRISAANAIESWVIPVDEARLLAEEAMALAG